MSAKKLNFDDLNISFDIDMSNEKASDGNFISQIRIEKAIEQLVNIRDLDYNIYIAGNFSRNDKNTIKNTIVQYSSENQYELYDYCYVNNFKNPKLPNVLKLPPGSGNKLFKEMNDLVNYLSKSIPSVFESKEYEKRIQDIISDYDDRQRLLYEGLQKKAENLDFIVKPSTAGIMINPVISGKVIGEKEFSELPKETQEKIEKRRKELEEDINTFLRQTRDLSKEKQQKIKKINDEMGIFVVGHKIDEIKEKFIGIKNIEKYLDEVEEYTLNNIAIFLPQPKQAFPFAQAQSKYAEYKINVFVDNEKTKSVPVIYEENPTYYNVFGKIEKQAYFGAFITNFTNIIPGAIHKANGGYLIIDALSIISNPGVWDTLKKTIMSKKITIEDWGERYGLIASEALKPQPIDLDANIVMIGSEYVFDLLYKYDADFAKLFKIKTNFDSLVQLNKGNIEKYISKIIAFCEEKNLKKPDNSGIEAILKYSLRLSGSRKKIWAYSDDVLDLIRESQLNCEKNRLTYDQINKTIENKRFLKNIWKEKIYEMIQNGQIILNLTGTKVGQVNGLSVIDFGNYAFGRPNRITAKTFMGKGGVVNIETESKLSGRIFDKASLIIKGYLGSMYAYDKMLSLSGTISFDQSYSYIEGDSASIAESIALLSSLAGIGLKQNLSVTGSMDQNGIAQPIGGVNEKIEGFYEICKLTGNLNGSGVVIPSKNVENLILSDEVINSIKSGEFSLYAIDNIDDAIKIFTDMEAGVKKKNRFSKNSFHYLVDKKLKSMSQIALKISEGISDTLS